MRILLLFTFILISMTSVAAEHYICMNQLTEQANGWQIEVTVEQDLLQQKVRAVYDINSYLPPDKLKESIVRYHLDNIKLTFNKSFPATLSNAKVDLANEVTVTFDVLKTPAIISFISYTNTMFKEERLEHSVLKVKRIGAANESFKLDYGSYHTVDLSVNKNRLTLIPIDHESLRIDQDLLVFVLLGIAIVIFIAFILFAATKLK